MKRSCVLFAVVMSACSAFAAPPVTLHDGLPVDYGVLTYKSIFAKDRRTSPPPVEVAGTQPAAAAPEPPAVPVLVGVVLEDDGYVAFLEDPVSTKLTQLRLNDVLPNNAGVVTNVTLDFIEYSAPHSHEAQRVLIGQNLAGVETSLSSGSASNTAEPGAGSDSTGSSAAAGTTSATPSAAPSGGSDSVLERLRRRRQQELAR
jgi:hypothetical protein